jgi:hypothetical protein
VRGLRLILSEAVGGGTGARLGRQRIPGAEGEDVTACLLTQPGWRQEETSSACPVAPGLRKRGLDVVVSPSTRIHVRSRETFFDRRPYIAHRFAVAPLRGRPNTWVAARCFAIALTPLGLGNQIRSGVRGAATDVMRKRRGPWALGRVLPSLVNLGLYARRCR